jgi:C4-dicarboxylate-binding protein DctP
MRTQSIFRWVKLSVASFCAIGIWASLGFCQDKPIIIRYVTQLPATHLLTQADFRLGKLIEEKTQGKVKFEVYPAGQLYKGMELLKAIMTGAVEMGTMYNAIFTGPVPLMDIFDIPFLFKNYDEVTRFWESDMGEKMREQLIKINIRAIAYSAYGESFSICSHKPLLKPADFKGMKIRCNHNMGADAVKEFGASPVLFAAGDVYEALQRKTIDAASSGPTTIKERKWHEVTEYATIAWSSYSVWPIMVNNKFWNDLPNEIRNALLEAGKDHQKHVLNKTHQSDLDAVEFLKSKLQVSELTTQDQKVWADASQEVINKWLKRTGKDGEDCIQWIKTNLPRSK